MFGKDDDMLKKMLEKKKPMLNIKIGWDADPEKKDDNNDLAPDVKDDDHMMAQDNGDETRGMPGMDMKANALKSYLGKDIGDDDDEMDMDKKPSSFAESVKMHAMKGLKKAKAKA